MGPTSFFFDLLFSHLINDKLSLTATGFPLLTGVMLVDVNHASSTLLFILGIIASISGIIVNALRAKNEIDNMHREKKENEEKDKCKN